MVLYIHAEGNIPSLELLPPLKIVLTPYLTAFLARTADMALSVGSSISGNPDSTGTVTQVGYIGGKRYIRGVIAKTGTHSTGTPIGLLVVKGNAIHSSD